MGANGAVSRQAAAKSIHCRLPTADYEIVRLFVTLKTYGTRRAAFSASCLSNKFPTAPSRVTLPFFTMILMGALTWIAYFSKPDRLNMAR